MISHKHKEPEKKCGCEGAADPGTSRRDFLFKVGIGLNVVAGAMISLPLVGYVMSSFIKKMDTDMVSVGKLEKFPVGTTRLGSYKNPNPRPWDGHTADIPCWVRRIDETQFQVFAINCTHLGCPVRWFDESKLFMCPCHGGAFYQDGSHASGPPPRGLYTYAWEVRGDELFISAGLLPTLANPHPGETPKA